MEPGLALMDAAVTSARMQTWTPMIFTTCLCIFSMMFVLRMCRGTTPSGDYFFRAQMSQVVTQQLQEQLPGLLQPIMDGLAEQLAEVRQGENKLSEILESALQPVLDAVGQRDSAPGTSAPQDLQAYLQKQLEAQQADMELQLKSLRDDMEGTHAQQIRGVGKEVEALQTQLAQAMKTANTTEQGRFGTLEGALKTRFDALEASTKGRIDLLNNDFGQKLDGVDKALKQHVQDLAKVTQDVKTTLDKVEIALAAWDKTGTKITTHCDRMESMVREKFGSLQGDTNKIIGETAQLGRDWQACLRSNTKALDSLQQAVANMGAAMGNRPLDSTGVTEAVEIGRSMQTQIAELVNQATETSSHLRDVRDQLRQQPRATEIRTTPEAPMPATTAPSVINLASRIPPTNSGGLVRVILSNGREVLTSEDEVLGPPAFPYGARR